MAPPSDELADELADEPAGLTDETRGRFERDLRRRLNDRFGHGPWLVATEYDQASVRLALRLRSYGDPAILAVGSRTGVGPIDRSVPLLSIGLPSTGDVLLDRQTGGEVLGNPPAEVVAAIDAWDPDRRARAVGSLTITAGEVAGRPTFGARSKAWAALEDKLAIEPLWRAAGIPLAPTEQVAVADVDGLLRAHRRLATERGTVWAGDNHAGFHGGGLGTFWVPDEAVVTSMAERLVRHRLVRIMPFIEGVPCSIHGIVVPDGRAEAAVSVFRPAEMMTLRDPVERRFVYGRAGTYWDPPPADRAAMRDVARRIGAQLHRQVAYRGAFTVDGVLGVDGFLPTEVNPRFGAALGSEMPTLEGPPLDLFFIHLALVDGRLDGVDPELLERWVVTNHDRHRWASGFLDFERAPDRERTAVVTSADDGRLVVDETEQAGPGMAGADRQPGRSEDGRRVASVRWGSARGGGMLMIDGGPLIDKGRPTAPLLVEIIGVVDRHWGLGLPPLEAARSVR